MTTTPAGPIFVVGAAGSGTTLMRLILDSHDNIAIAQETGFARLLLANEWVPFWDFGGEWYGRVGLSRSDLEARLREFYGGIFADFAAGRGATRWGDKTPFHLWHLPLLARVFPDAAFIGLVRHPGAVTHSTRRRMGHEWEKSLRFWRRDTVELLLQAAELGDRVRIVRYEDVVTKPEPVLRELFDWLGEPWSDQLLAFHEVHSSRGTQAEVEGATRSDRPIDPGRLDAWTATSTPERSQRLARGRVAALARALGYRPETALPADTWLEDYDRHLLDGDGVARLVATRRRVGWKRRPRPSLPNRPLTVGDLDRLRKRAAAGRRRPEALERLGDRAAEAGRGVLHRLPPDARAVVRRWLEIGRR